MRSHVNVVKGDLVLAPPQQVHHGHTDSLVFCKREAKNDQREIVYK